MHHIRLANEAEINAIRDKSDLLPEHTQILALDSDTSGTSIAVVRNCFEINPVIFGEATNNVRKLRFIYALEERLLGAGVDRYYTQVNAEDTQYQKILEKMGYERVSPTPEYRLLRVIK